MQLFERHSLSEDIQNVPYLLYTLGVSLSTYTSAARYPHNSFAAALAVRSSQLVSESDGDHQDRVGKSDAIFDGIVISKQVTPRSCNCSTYASFSLRLFNALIRPKTRLFLCMALIPFLILNRHIKTPLVMVQASDKFEKIVLRGFCRHQPSRTQANPSPFQPLDGPACVIMLEGKE